MNVLYYIFLLIQMMGLLGTHSLLCRHLLKLLLLPSRDVIAVVSGQQFSARSGRVSPRSWQVLGMAATLVVMLPAVCCQAGLQKHYLSSGGVARPPAMVQGLLPIVSIACCYSEWWQEDFFKTLLASTVVFHFQKCQWVALGITGKSKVKQ